MKVFNTVLEEKNIEINIQKSRFISYIAPVSNEEACQAYIEKIRKMHWNATHHVPAYMLLNGSQKFSDDGEPSGTAGMPVLESLKHKNMKNVVIVVVRYFGGIKLGTGGLVRAYGQSAKEIIEEAPVYSISTHETIRYTMDYGNIGKVQTFLANQDIVQGESDYSDVVKGSFYCIPELAETLIAQLTDLTHGIIEIEDGDQVLLGVREGKYIFYEKGD